jgi:hypothetical protein
MCPSSGNCSVFQTRRNALDFVFIVSVVRLSSLGTAATTGLLYQPQMIDGDYGAIGGMKTGRETRSTRRKPAPVPLCPSQIPHDLTRAATVGSQRLTAWATTGPPHVLDLSQYNSMLLHIVVHTKMCLSENKTLPSFRVIFHFRRPCLCPIVCMFSLAGRIFLVALKGEVNEWYITATGWSNIILL